ncbi:hypothetical protein [Polaribacter sp.]|uniref:hypothetical protein n=1 Tax=Polaribacter sp. TaxID=1920175 RepID=UPI003F6D3082
MKIIRLRKNTSYQKEQSRIMGELITKVTSVNKYILCFPVKNIAKYEEKYYKEKLEPEHNMLFI